MQDEGNTFNAELSGLPKGGWLKTLAKVSTQHGSFHPLGKRHFATFVEEGATLLVTFETIQGIRALSDTDTPLGWDLVKGLQWSHLGVISDGDTWFRDPAIYAHFDRLIDDGFFDNFEQVIFYGAGPCAYAAAAYSVASPGATVIAIQPQATLDPRVTEWDDRFSDMRRTDFTSRYGYAPDMLDAADRAFVIYDPREERDAMHAALFTRDNVTKLRTRHLGAAIQTHLMEMQLLFRLFAKASKGKLNEASFAALWRARRDYPPYLRKLVNALEEPQRPTLIHAVCTNVTSRMTAPRFARRLRGLKEAAANPEQELAQN